MTLGAVSPPRGKSAGWGYTLLRAGLALGAFLLLWAGFAAQQRMNIDRAANFTSPWGDWLKWIGLLALAGVAFELAARVPMSIRFRPGRALLLGIIPLFFLAEMLVGFGPTSLVNFTMHHLRFVERHLLLYRYLAQIGSTSAVLLGVAIAAGFPSADMPSRY